MTTQTIPGALDSATPAGFQDAFAEQPNHSPVRLGDEVLLLEDEPRVRVVRELLRQSNAAMEGLLKMGAVKNRNAPVEGVAQMIACACLDLTPDNQTGYDAVDTAGRRYEIKGIRTDENNAKTSHVSDPSCFHYLVLVVVATDYRVRHIWKFARDPLIENSNVFKWKDEGRSHVALNRDTSKVEGAQDLLDEFRQRFPFWESA